MQYIHMQGKSLVWSQCKPVFKRALAVFLTEEAGVLARALAADDGHLRIREKCRKHEPQAHKGAGLQNIKISNQLWDFEIFVLSWYSDIVKCPLIYLSYSTSWWYFDIIMVRDCRISKYQINFEILILSWYFDIIKCPLIYLSYSTSYYHDISIFKNKAMMDCRISQYQIRVNRVSLY